MNQGPSERAAKPTVNETVKEPPGAHVVTKVLGCGWDVQKDTLFTGTLKAYERGKDMPVTMRNVLRVIGMIFDPLGILTPITISFKKFMQKITQSKCKWDQELETDMKSEWIQLLEFLPYGKELCLDRYYFEQYHINEITNVVLHGFCDASKNAIAAVIYIVGKMQNNDVVQRFVMGKSCADFEAWRN